MPIEVKDDPKPTPSIGPRPIKKKKKMICEGVPSKPKSATRLLEVAMAMYQIDRVASIQSVSPSQDSSKMPEGHVMYMIEESKSNKRDPRPMRK